MARETYLWTDKGIIVKSRDGEYTKEYLELNKPSSNPFSGYGSDTLGKDVNGVLNHADGKRYDSKSQYTKAVRAKGCYIVGNDWNNKTYQRELRGDFVRKQEVAEARNRVLEGNNGR